MIKRREILFITIICSAILIMLLYSNADNSLKVKKYKTETITFNQSERNYIKERDTINLSLDEELQHLKPVFIEEYMNAIMEPSQLKVKIVVEKNPERQGTISVISDDFRKNASKYMFTAPIFEVTDSMFVRAQDSDSKQNQFTGVYATKKMTENDKKIISYDNKPIDLINASTVEEAVTLAEKRSLDCIIGDQSAILVELKKRNIEKNYTNTKAELYKSNVCIVIDKDDETLYQIINQCVQNADKFILMRQAQEHWYDYQEPFVQKGKYRESAILLVIVFTAVFVAFFFYYQSNKNLYGELTARMNQLTASKQEMQTTFNGVSYYMAELTPNGTIIDINQAFWEYLNKEAIGKTLSEVLDLSDEMAKVLFNDLENTKLTGSGKTKEITLRHQILEVSIFPILTSKNKVEKLLFMASDITGERMAEQQLLQDNKMIAVGQLAAGIAHEIRNPLGIIRNYCYVLKNINEEKVRKQAIQTIEKSVETSSKIIDTLLNFSRISKEEIKEIKIKQHIDSVISLNKGLLKEKQINISIKCEEDFFVHIFIESFDMILINLISNAAYAMGEEGELVISINKIDDRFCVEVSDSGVGIKEEFIEEIFNPFFTTRSDNEGNGLGLYIVYNEVKKMNGEIQVVSEVGKGSTFKVTIPIKTEVEYEE